MKWHYNIKGNHVHVRVYMNGAQNGELVFLPAEFHEIRAAAQALEAWASHNYVVEATLNGRHFITFIDDDGPLEAELVTPVELPA